MNLADLIQARDALNVQIAASKKKDCLSEIQVGARVILKSDVKNSEGKLVPSHKGYRNGGYFKYFVRDIKDNNVVISTDRGTRVYPWQSEFHTIQSTDIKKVTILKNRIKP